MSARTYSTPRLAPDIDLDLSKNEGGPATADLVRSIDRPNDLVRRYPDSTALREQLAGLYGVRADQVLVTAGGDDGLFRCFLARLGSGSTAVATKPTFEMISIYADQVGAHLVEIDWWEGPFPTADIITAEADAVFVVSPNNPTGATITGAELRKVSAEVGFVVLDAAYAEFADEDLTSVALELGNVVVVRTLSKAYGLAGLRVGYLLGPSDLIEEMSSFGSPYPVSALSVAIATEALSEPDDAVGRFVGEIRSERSALPALLDGLGIRSLPSQGNFILVDVVDAEWVTDACAALGVGIRRFPESADLDHWVRITLPGNQEDFSRLKQTLTTALAPEALLFDLDGVLADVTGSYRQSIIETAASFGVTVIASDIDEAKASGDANDDWDLSRRLMADRGVELEYGQVVTRFEEIYQGHRGSSGLKVNERPLVDSSTWSRWAKALPLGVVTGRPRADAVEVLERFGLLANTSILVTREDAPLKPDPEPVRLALERLAVDHAWLIGDTPDDVEAARAARVVPIGVVSPGADPEQAAQRLSRAARTLNQTLDVEELLP